MEEMTCWCRIAGSSTRWNYGKVVEVVVEIVVEIVVEMDYMIFEVTSSRQSSIYLSRSGDNSYSLFVRSG